MNLKESKSDVLWDEISKKYPLARALTEEDSLPIIHSLLTQHDAAKTVFVKKNYSRHFLCTLNPGRDGPTEIKDENVVEEIDTKLHKYLESIISKSRVISYSESFVTGDLVRLKKGLQSSSLLSQCLVTLHDSESCLGDESWGKIGIIQSIKISKKTRNTVLQVRDALRDNICQYNEGDIIFADGSSPLGLSDKYIPKNITIPDEASRRVLLAPTEISVDSFNPSYGKDNMLSDNMNVFWQCASNSTNPTFRVKLPSAHRCPEFQIYLKDHGNKSLKKIEVSFSTDGSALAKLKDLSLNKTDKWTSILSSDEIKKLNTKHSNAFIQVVVRETFDTSSKVCNVSGIRLLEQLCEIAPLVVGERVTLAANFTENNGIGWCLGRVTNRKSGAVLCAPSPLRKNAEQRNVIVISDDGCLGIFRASWLERTPLVHEFEEGKMVRLNHITWSSEDQTTKTAKSVKCLGSLEDKCFGVVTAVGNVCKDIMRNIEVELLIDRKDVHKGRPPPPRRSFYHALDLMPAYPCTMLSEPLRQRLKAIVQEVFEDEDQMEERDEAVDQQGLEIFSVISSAYGPEQAVEKVKKWVSECSYYFYRNIFQSDIAPFSLNSTAGIGSHMENESGGNTLHTWTCKSCNFKKNNPSSTKCIFCKKKGEPWVCSVCSTSNRVTSSTCDVCCYSKSGATRAENVPINATEIISDQPCVVCRSTKAFYHESCQDCGVRKPKVNLVSRMTNNNDMSSRKKPLVFESNHPVSESVILSVEICIPDATYGMLIYFDKKSALNARCDFVRFYKDAQQDDCWGDRKYPQVLQHFPGTDSSKPPLRIDANKCMMYYSLSADATGSYWGFRIYVVKIEQTDSILNNPSDPDEAFYSTPLLSDIDLSEAVVVESAHPLVKETSTIKEVLIRGAKALLVYFDPATELRRKKDYVKLCKDSSLTEYWGEKKYSGVKKRNYPGCGRLSPLRIPGDRFVVSAQTQTCSEQIWGFRLVVIADPTVSSTDALSVSKIPDGYVVESRHPYLNHMDTYETISTSEGTSFLISFDPMTSLENDYDFVRFLKDDSHTEVWGETSYTGGFLGRSRNYPGVDGLPPLKIPSRSFVIHFQSDSCNNDWGLRCFVKVLKGNELLDHIDVPEDRRLLAWNLFSEQRRILEAQVAAKVIHAMLPDKVFVKNHNHALLATKDNCLWGCNGAAEAGGCKTALVGLTPLKGDRRWRCSVCSTEYCELCIAANLDNEATEKPNSSGNDECEEDDDGDMENLVEDEESELDLNSSDLLTTSTTADNVNPQLHFAKLPSFKASFRKMASFRGSSPAPMLRRSSTRGMFSIRGSSLNSSPINEYEPIPSLQTIVKLKDFDDNTAAHHAAQLKLQKTYELLLLYNNAQQWLPNAIGQTAAGIADGIRGNSRVFELHSACRKHDLLSADLTACVIRCPHDFDVTGPYLSIWNLISQSKYAEALEEAYKLPTEHLKLYVSLTCLYSGYGDKATDFELQVYLDQIDNLSDSNMRIFLDPMFFYVIYKKFLNSTIKSKMIRTKAADALRALKTFTNLKNRLLTNTDNLDSAVEIEERMDTGKSEEDENDDDADLEEALPSDAPENEWLLVKRQTKKGSQSMDKIMALTGLKDVKIRAMAVYKEVLLTPLRPVDLQARVTMNFLFVGNPGCGKTTVAELLAKAMVEVGFRSNPDPFLTNAGDILKSKDPVGDFEKLVEAANGGTVFIDEAYLFKPAPRGQSANASNGVLDYLLKVCETKREDTTFILAGYKDDIEELLTYNEGFPSRFPKQFTFEFEDYTELQLMKIMKGMVKARGFRFETKKECGVNIAKVLSSRIARGAGVKGFGNAREVRNRIDQCILKQTERLGSAILHNTMGLGSITATDMNSPLRILTLADTVGAKPDLVNSDTLKELDSMIGLASVKAAVRGLMELQLQNYDRELRGEKIELISLHRVFIGNPGTGKTTVARIYGQLLKEFGFLSDGSLVSVTGSDLIGDVVGAAATRTAQLFAKAKGKVLFIDEAYVLDPKRRNNLYGGNALDTLVEKIQASEGADIAVILAGYEEEMRDLFRNCGNAGLSRRFNLSEAVRFEDFNDEELKRILTRSAAKAGLIIQPDVATEVIRIVARGRRLDGFGNAGAVETILGRAKLNKSKRIAASIYTESSKQNTLDSKVSGSKYSPTQPLQSNTNSDFPHPKALAAAAKGPNRDLLLLEDFISDKVSVDNAHKVFDGLHHVNHIHALIDRLDATIVQARLEGKPAGDVMSSSHLVFTGDSGTGKSSVAQKFGKVFYNLEILPRDTVTYTTGKGMQAGFVGQTPILVSELMSKAKGGVLVIDEAIGLYPDRLNYGEEAIQALLDNMSRPEYKENLIVILISQEKHMDLLFSKSPALRSRFRTKPVVFREWTGEQAASAAVSHITVHEKVEITKDAKDALLGGFKSLRFEPGWSSGRDVFETVIPAIYSARADRLTKLSDGVKQNSYTSEDVENAFTSIIASRTTKKAKKDYWNAATSLHSNGEDEDDNDNDNANGFEGDSESKNDDSTGNEHTKSDDDQDNSFSQPQVDFGGHYENSHIQEIQYATLDNELTVDPPEGNGPPNNDGPDIWAALEEACRELGYGIHELERILDSKEFPPELISLLEEKTDKPADAVRRMILPQCEKFLQQVRMVIKQMTEKRTEEENAREKANQEKIRKLGKCPMNYEWLKIEGGYQCAGGSHFCRDDEIDKFCVDD